MNYRKEIDGLRAFAILPVILFHAGFESFSGGFIGVDVFFVISGYLITTIIISELEQKKFSIVNFYERRARRILPALFFMMLVCLPFAWNWMMPSDMEDFLQSLISVSLFSSNHLFLHESGYFEAAAEIKPLLHTWSLAVEEQYYMLFPLFLMYTWRFGKRPILAILIISFLISLSLAQWGTIAKPAASFFILPTRGWELLVGTFSAFYLSQANRIEFSRGISEIGGGLGLTLILYSVFSYSKDTPFPGFYALAPTLGTAFIILFATSKTAIGSFVGNKIFTSIGLISYSAYLWHQPLFAFARHKNLEEPNHILFSSLIILTFILGFLSWKFIETPFRDKTTFNRRSIYKYSIIGSLFFIGFGAIGLYNNGYHTEDRANEIKNLADRTRINYGLHPDCVKKFNQSTNCQTSNEPEVLVWGDSYAMHLIQGLISSNSEIKLIQKTISVCGPLLDIAPINSKYPRLWSEKCIKNNDDVFEYLKNTKSIKYVVMSSPFGQYVNSDANVITRSGEITPGNKVAYTAPLKTISNVKKLGKVPVLFSPTPQNGQNIGHCLMKAKFFDKPLSNCDINLSDSYARQIAVYELLSRVERFATVVWLNNGICHSNTCKAFIEETFIYRDGGHLSHEGSAYLGKKMNFYNRIKYSK